MYKPITLLALIAGLFLHCTKDAQPESACPDAPAKAVSGLYSAVKSSYQQAGGVVGGPFSDQLVEITGTDCNAVHVNVQTMTLEFDVDLTVQSYTPFVITGTNDNGNLELSYTDANKELYLEYTAANGDLYILRGNKD